MEIGEVGRGSGRGEPAPLVSRQVAIGRMLRTLRFGCCQLARLAYGDFLLLRNLKESDQRSFLAVRTPWRGNEMITKL
jgi:hypothetical protein